MAEALRVVARFADGRILKGTTLDFNPIHPYFHLMLADGRPPETIQHEELKAVFFVKSLAGDGKRAKPPGFVTGAGSTPHGRKVAVLFRDGELLCGYSMAYTADRAGFFLLPADSASNNTRIWVVTAATKQVEIGPAAEALAQRVIASRVIPA